MVNYYLDIFQVDKKHSKALDSCADRALRFGPRLSESYVAKGVAHSAKKEYDEAVKYLEKAHELDPNSGVVIHFLTEFYSIHVFNTAKYLEYALTGVKIDRASPVDSATTSFKYFHLANAFASAGFLDEALMYSDKSLELDPNNIFAKHFRAYVVFAKNRNIKEAREAMLIAYRKDTMRLDIVQEVAKLYVMERDYRKAYKAYEKLIALRKLYNVNVYAGESLRILMVCDSLGYKQQSDVFRKEFLDYMATDQSIYKHLTLSTWLAYNGKKQESIKEFKTFLEEDSNFHYWAMLLDLEPYMDPIRNDPEYRKLLKQMESDFWENKREIRKLMESKGLL
jgi:tetratricopeptide (TPR) repeat protein